VPELPDLVYLERRLSERIAGRSVVEVAVREPIVLRMLIPGGFPENLAGRRFESVRRHGPFLVFALTDRVLVMHLMLAGKIHDVAPGVSARVRDRCFSLTLDDGGVLVYADSKKMGKIYLDERGPGTAGGPAHASSIPLFATQGMDISSEAFTLERFRAAIARNRRQVRVFLMDQTVLSAIGNAYADEILFDARIHPKARCNELGPAQVDQLYASVRSVMSWGITEVEEAAMPMDVKVRGHVKVRNRKGEPCPVCGQTIRRASVLGYDTFFCPGCQPLPEGGIARKNAIPWDRLSGLPRSPPRV
jgi:formamidopyrimidine-DNA glycosylase